MDGEEDGVLCDDGVPLQIPIQIEAFPEGFAGEPL